MNLRQKQLHQESYRESIVHDLMEMTLLTERVANNITTHRQVFRRNTLIITLLLALVSLFFLFLALVPELNSTSQALLLNLSTEFIGATVVFAILDIFWLGYKENDDKFAQLAALIKLVVKQQSQVETINRVIMDSFKHGKLSEDEYQAYMSSLSILLDEMESNIRKARVMATEMYYYDSNR